MEKEIPFSSKEAEEKFYIVFIKMKEKYAEKLIAQAKKETA